MMLFPRMSYVTFLTYLHPYNLRHPIDITNLVNSCEASSDSFFLPSNDQLTTEVNFRNLRMKFINFEKDMKD